MRIRRLELRVIALCLTVLWTLTAVVVLLGYRPGGPLDLVVGLAVVPVALIALVGLAWPPARRRDGLHLGILLLGIIAALLLVAALGAVLSQLTRGGPQTLLPSLEAAYPWAMALLATAVFAAIGAARRALGPSAPPGRAPAVGAMIGVAAAVVVGAAFGTAAIANEIAVRELPSASSRYGPAGSEDPQPCDGPLVMPASANLELAIRGAIDDRSIGQAVLDGPREGDDFRWQANVASDRALGRYGAARIGNEAWAAEPREPWEPVASAIVEGLDLDRRFVSIALAANQTAIAQDLGLVLVGGARARHCRIATTGDVIGAALPVARWIVDGADIGRWRGAVDYYVFLDGSVGLAMGSVNGEAFVLDRSGLLGTLDFELSIIDRGRDLAVAPPA
jgi:hypothetical protein